MKMNPKFIAEIGSNHNNDQYRIERLVRTAKELGFWAVKFQLFRADHLYWHGMEKEIETSLKRELELDLVEYTRDICDRCGIKLIYTPFDSYAVDFLNDNLIPNNYKISSFDILRKDFINKIYSITNNTLFISTGLSTYLDLRDIIDTLTKTKSESILNVCLMHCVSKYPTKKKESNIHVINDLIQRFSLFVKHFGYSDHTVNIDVVKAAIKMGAEYIELHFDLDDKKGDECVYGHCWTPRKIKNLFKFKDNWTKCNYINNLNYNYIINNFGTAKPLTKDELGQRADPSDGLRPMLYKRVKKSS